MMREIRSLIACAVLVAGCASSASTMVSNDTAVISAWGTGLEDKPRVLKATLTEAANLTRAHLYRYFVILKSEDVSTTGIRTTPGQTLRNETAHDRGLGTTTFTAPESAGASFTTPDETELYVRLRFETTIRMYRVGEIDPTQKDVFDPDAILGSVTTAP